MEGTIRTKIEIQPQDILLSIAKNERWNGQEIRRSEMAKQAWSKLLANDSKK